MAIDSIVKQHTCVYNLAVTLRTTRPNSKKIPRDAHFVFIHFVRTSQETATFTLNNSWWLIFYNRSGECLQRGTHWFLI